MKHLVSIIAVLSLFLPLSAFAANEITVGPGLSTGMTVYAIVRNSQESGAATVWIPGSTAFAALTTGNYSNAAVALTENSGTGYYVASFPTGIATAGSYFVTVYQQAGGSPAVGDLLIGEGPITWGGSASVGLPGINAQTGKLQFDGSNNIKSTPQTGVNVTQIAGQTANASSAVTFPASVGTSTYAGGAVASVTGAVGSVTAAITLPSTVPSTFLSTDTTIAALPSAAGNATAVWAAGTRTITGGSATASNLPSDYLSSSEQTQLSNASSQTTSSNIAGAVLNATASSYNTAGTIGAKINASGSASDPWATALPGSYTGGTAGYIVGNNLNATVTSRQASGSAVTLPTNVPSGFLSTDTTATNIYNQTTAAAQATDTQTGMTAQGYTSTLATNLGTTNSTVAGLPSASANASAVWAAGTRTVTALPNVTVGGYASGEDPWSLVSAGSVDTGYSFATLDKTLLAYLIGKGVNTISGNNLLSVYYAQDGSTAMINNSTHFGAPPSNGPTGRN